MLQKDINFKLLPAWISVISDVGSTNSLL